MSAMLSPSARKYAAEFLGTFMLAYTVLVAASGGLAEVTPIVAGFALMLIVYLFGPLSGAHLNPAITIGQLSIRGITLADAVPYIAAQLLGSLLALALAWSSIPEIASPVAVDALRPILFEVFGTGVLSFGVTSVLSGRLPAGVSGFVVGGSLLVGLIFAMVGSLGVLNPAVAISLRVFSVAYLLAPIIGGVLGAWLHKIVAGTSRKAA